MAITDSQKVDYLFKKLGYGVAKTDTSTVKSPSNESIASPLLVRGDGIWTQSDQILGVIPSSNSSVVTVYTDALGSTVQTTNDGTASANRTWKTNLTDWIDTSFGSTYQVKVYLATTGNATPQTSGTQLFSDGTGNNDEWYFDYQSGVLNFIGTNLPSQTFTGKSIFISGARYTGTKGLSTFGNTVFTGNSTFSIINANVIYENNIRVVTANSTITTTGDVTGFGNISNIALTLANTTVTAGTYGNTLGLIARVTVDNKGRITSAANIAITQVGNLSFNDTTISSSGNIYLNAQSAGIVQISGTDALGLPAGNSISRPASPNLGYIRFNTDDGSLEYWDGNSWTYPGAATITSETINADGVNATYTLNSNSSADGLLVSINGTMQQPFTAYTMSGNEITFIETPQDTDIIEVRKIAAGATSVSSLSYGPETSIQLTVGNVNVTGNIIPSANITYSLGSPDRQWKDLWVSNNTIYIGGTAVTVSNGALSVGGSGPIVTYSNSNVASYLTTYTGNITANSFVGDRFTYSNGVSILDSVISLVTSNAAIQAGLITELSSNAAVQAGLISAAVTAAGETTANANTAMKGYVDGQVSTLTSNAAVQTGLIADTNTAITTANTAMKGYVDAINTTLTSNAAVQSGLIADTNTAITTANTALKGYVDAINTTLTSNAAVQSGAIVTANTAMKGYVDAINSTLTANASLQAGNIATIQSTYAQLSGASFSGAISASSLTLSTTALAITSGGTGGTSASEALNNLFPSGETSGYVLKTSGPGTYYWAAESGASSTVGTIISTSRVYKTATSGQTVFTALGTYTPGAGQLRVYINGVRQFDSAYTETNSSAITLSTGVTSGTIVLAEIDAYTDYNAYANATYSSPVGTISATTVQDALAELDTEKAALSGATFTGNISVPYITGATTVTGNLTVGGNLNVLGNVTTFNSNNVTIQDALIYLASNNGADVLDIGFVSSFTDAIRYQHTGLARDASDGTWKLFANVVAEPTTTIDFTNATYSNLRVGQLTSTGIVATGPATVGNLTANNTSITGTMTQDGVVGGIVPVGGIIMWSGNIASIPTRWALCNGSNGTPDLRDRFIVGAGSTYAPGATGGSKDAIAVSHSHTATSTFTGDALGTHGHSASSSSTFTGNALLGHDHSTSASSSFSGSTLPTHTHVATSTVTDSGHYHIQGYSNNASIAPRYGSTDTGTSKIEDGFGSSSRTTAPHTSTSTTGITVGTTITSVSAGTPSGSVSTSVSVNPTSAGTPGGLVSTSTSITGASAGTPSGSVSTTVNTAGSSGTNANLPPYYALAYIMRIS
jgi:hypothetical protein